MSLLIKNSGVWKNLVRDSVPIRDGSIKVPTQLWLKNVGVWQPIFDDPVAQPASPQIWGMAQFADTDFTGGKTDPNQAGDPYERWTGPQHFIDDELTYAHDGNGNAVITLNIPFPQYGYFAHPASMGIATFTDNANGFTGGWDGAKRPDGGFDMATGPLMVTYDDGSGPKDWYVYRTDFSGIGQYSWTVSF